ncbi:hypothetical protein AM1BK_04890 [Neobacillus kokaensis]|uniref:Uncharacterized protein n=1 Tax=Neobacillus kokaensis TaxID=2759023 RepID=A0ABQ3MYG2_9BACI|nr:hypothetical protein AM1BK_04890 [Neobacillus kokaensis]
MGYDERIDKSRIKGFNAEDQSFIGCFFKINGKLPKPIYKRILNIFMLRNGHTSFLSIGCAFFLTAIHA